MTSNPDDSTELARMQRWFQAVVSHPDGVEAGATSPEAEAEFNSDANPLESILTGSSKLDPANRIAVYANAYFARLVDCLGEVFPILKRTLGEEAFEGFAAEYLKENPSRSYTLHRLGVRFPEFLAVTRPPREDPSQPDWADFLVELARFELDLYEVFDGPGIEDGPRIEAAQLEVLNGPAAGTARLVPAPCLRLVETQFPVSEFYTQARGAALDAELEYPEPTPSWVALTRRDFVVRRLPLVAAEYALLKQLKEGAPFGPTLEAAAECEGLDETMVGVWFARWAREELFIGVVVGS